MQSCQSNLTWPFSESTMNVHDNESLLTGEVWKIKKYVIMFLTYLNVPGKLCDLPWRERNMRFFRIHQKQ